MMNISWIVAVSTTFIFCFSTASKECTSLSSHYFDWLTEDGSLVLPNYFDGLAAENDANDKCCGPNCSEMWHPLADAIHCNFCTSKNSVICHGSDVYNVPSPEILPSTNLTLLKMSGVGLIALPPKSFSGLTIHKLVIENSNLTFIAHDSFSAIKSIKFLYLRNNTLDYLSEAGYLFRGLHELKFLSLESNKLKVLSSLRPANLQKLEYLSLAGNPIYDLDVFFLQNSALKFLDLKGVIFKVKLTDLEDSGFSSLPASLHSLDLKRAIISVEAVEKILKLLNGKNITMLNLAFLKSSNGLLLALKSVAKSLQFLSFEGTNINNMFHPKPKEKKFINSAPFVSLRELNMKNCNIKNLGTGEVFKAFPNLNILSLSGNHFFRFDLSLFINLPALNYMDLSKINIKEIFTDTNITAKNLNAMDLSSVNFDVVNEYNGMFKTMPYLERLSLCNAIMTDHEVNDVKSLLHLKFLDLSGTLPHSQNLTSAFNDLFALLNSSLIELHFSRNLFKFSDDYSSFFSSLSSLKVLDLTDNLSQKFSPSSFGPALKHLKMSQNIVNTWYSAKITNESELKYVDLSNNQITFISDGMLHDFYKLNSLDLSNNPLICHTKIIALVCADMMNKTLNKTTIGWKQYHCYDLLSNSYRLFSQPKDCNEYYNEVSTTQRSHYSGETTTISPSQEVLHSYSWKWEWIYLSIGLIVLIFAVGSIIYVNWWKLRCYIHRYFSLRKAQLLRTNGNSTIKSDVQYDVFVSYSDVDRSWVLEHLIPNMEAEGDISLCFHERDFQVGLSILENIIECMDRSQSLLLIVSSGFVHSKWCQFEMHLAQYRLIETLRNQLVLVLLEDIPKKMRPQTLHHLMVTKTYLVWPRQPFKEDATELFWKRLKRALKLNHNYIFDV